MARIEPQDRKEMPSYQVGPSLNSFPENRSLRGTIFTARVWPPMQQKSYCVAQVDFPDPGRTGHQRQRECAINSYVFTDPSLKPSKIPLITTPEKRRCMIIDDRGDEAITIRPGYNLSSTSGYDIVLPGTVEQLLKFALGSEGGRSLGFQENLVAQQDYLFFHNLVADEGRNHVKNLMNYVRHGKGLPDLVRVTGMRFKRS